MMQGYHGKILKVDLTAQRVETLPLEAATLKTYVGGAGLAARLLYDMTSADTDPLGPENPLLAFTGPFTGTAVPSASRHHLAARSPLTGAFGESNVGGSWGVLFKQTGFDGIMVSGRSDSPVYMWVSDAGVEIRDARAIWGKDAYESAAWVKSETSSKAAVAVIGQAGERLVPLAGIPHIGHIVRSAARTGLGAVMGSKNLKAMAVLGSKRAALANPDALQEHLRRALPHVKKVTETFRKFGTSGGIDNYEKIGNFPVRNWRQGRWEGASRISGAAMHATILSGNRACLRCPIACGRHIKLTAGPYAPLDCEGPEYESIGMLGGACLIDDLPAICKANELCNRYGIDTISTGAVIAFAMEACEKGLLGRKDLDGIDLAWGRADAMIALVHKIGQREGIGALMGEGSQRFAAHLGRNAQDFAIHVKGLEPSAHDPRRFFSQALSYATAARGACHNASWSHPYEMGLNMPEIGIPEPQDPYQVEGKAALTAALQDLMCMMDCLILCRFTQVGKAVTAGDMVRWLGWITGEERDIGEFMRAGERVFTLKRLYNRRMGLSRRDDSLPLRFLTENRVGEGLTNQLPPMERLLDDYYAHRKWTPDGAPSQAKLSALGLG
jgi:aldehyde:ferredoxin oxidoreductase